MSYEYWPGTEVRRSTNNGFTLGFDADWTAIIDYSKASARSAAVAERRRIAGKDNSTIYGLSKKGERAKRKEPRQAHHGCHPTSNAGRLRALMAERGPLTHMELATETGLAYKFIGGYLKNDIKTGRVVKVYAVGEVLRYAMGAHA